ncbi:Longitudinals lacking protein, isoform G [Frankliniella fusca]|uniref:Longitudinals lacking protein, isoform G n=1 Tax=Frankliniella fusca TaxID=407009 RepID=A0AAE1LDC4_9NEOP|nr:Longitudinals lacking protein, isoform G [Frankliniella fusca]
MSCQTLPPGTPRQCACLSHVSLVFTAACWPTYPTPGPGCATGLAPGHIFQQDPTAEAPGAPDEFSTPAYRQAGCFPCHKCGKTYRWKGNLSQHLRNECGQAPKFKCPYCPYRSKHRSDLKNKHMKYKHPGMPFSVVPVNPFLAFESGNPVSPSWRQHGSHTVDFQEVMVAPHPLVPCQEDTVFPCPNCYRKFRWKGSLKTHLRLECGKEPSFFCPFCPHRSKLKGNLRKHIFNKHHDKAASMGDFWTNIRPGETY